MAMLNDVSSGALPTDNPTKQVESMVRQVNEWARSISNEDRTKIYRDNSGQNRIILGLLPNGEHGLVISKEGVDVLDVFS